MGRRSYRQYCAVARALDLVGERWALLLVRELLVGPRRFTDLLAGLRGIGPNLLARRLRQLERDGLVRRAVLPPPAACTVYELTELGAGLEPALLALGRWGGRLLGERCEGELFRPDWLVLALRVLFRPEASAGVRLVCEFRIDGEILHARIEDGALQTGRGPAAAPDLVISTGTETLLGAAAGEVSFEEAAASGRLEAAGAPGALRCLGRLFGGRDAGAVEA